MLEKVLGCDWFHNFILWYVYMTFWYIWWLFIVIAIILNWIFHIRAYRYNNQHHNLVIWSFYKDLSPYWIFWVIIILFLLLSIILFFTNKDKNSYNIILKDISLSSSWYVNTWNNFSSVVWGIFDERCWYTSHWINERCVQNIKLCYKDNWLCERYRWGKEWSMWSFDCQDNYTSVNWECVLTNSLPKSITDWPQREKIDISTWSYIKWIFQFCERWLVDKVVDWDTIYVNDKKIRLVGIDTPETVDPNKPIEKCWPEASSTLKDMVLNQKVCLLSDTISDDMDRYNRKLRYVFLLDGTNINAEMIKLWYSKSYNDFSFDLEDGFTELEYEVSKNKLWIWWNKCK
jgi:micrococcal nuclease